MTSAAILARLVALHPVDREWLLQSLPADTRARLVSELRSDGDVTKVSASGTSYGDPRDAISTAEASDVVSALQVEPPWLTGVVLRMAAWPWSAEVLKSLPFEHRPAPAAGGAPAVGGATAVKPALGTVILQALARRLPPYDEAELPTPVARRFDDLVQQISSSRSASEPPP